MNRNCQSAPIRCAGFSLLDLLLAMIVISAGITGLMRYHQTLLFQFSYSSELRQTWRLASQLLDIYPATLPGEFDHWHYFTQVEHVVDECPVIKATVKSPKGIEAELSRFICPYY